MKTTFIATIIIAFGLIVGLFIMSQNTNSTGDKKLVNNVTVESGKQIVEIVAKVGYTPRKSVASAGMPTILRVDTNGTFDCSSSIRIPSLNISKNLPQSGVTDIDLGTQLAGTLKGTCGMGMYPFEITFN